MECFLLLAIPDNQSYIFTKYAAIEGCSIFWGGIEILGIHLVLPVLIIVKFKARGLYLLHILTLQTESPLFLQGAIFFQLFAKAIRHHLSSVKCRRQPVHSRIPPILRLKCFSIYSELSIPVSSGFSRPFLKEIIIPVSISLIGITGMQIA